MHGSPTSQFKRDTKGGTIVAAPGVGGATREHRSRVGVSAKGSPLCLADASAKQIKKKKADKKHKKELNCAKKSQGSIS